MSDNITSLEDYSNFVKDLIHDLDEHSSGFRNIEEKETDRQIASFFHRKAMQMTIFMEETYAEWETLIKSINRLDDES